MRHCFTGASRLHRINGIGTSAYELSREATAAADVIIQTIADWRSLHFVAATAAASATLLG